jgi:hypothetical protein
MTRDTAITATHEPHSPPPRSCGHPPRRQPLVAQRRPRPEVVDEPSGAAHEALAQHRSDLARKRRTASRRVARLVVVCVAAALTPATTQLVTTGWASFVERPAGVGASADVAEADRADPATAPTPDTGAANPSDSAGTDAGGDTAPATNVTPVAPPTSTPASPTRPRLNRGAGERRQNHRDGSP